jgi:Ca2+-binding RTX toxin-like protein
MSSGRPAAATLGVACDDVLVGGVGNDTLARGVGADRYVFSANSGANPILGFSQNDGTSSTSAA